MQLPCVRHVSRCFQSVLQTTLHTCVSQPRPWIGRRPRSGSVFQWLREDSQVTILHLSLSRIF